MKEKIIYRIFHGKKAAYCNNASFQFQYLKFLNIVLIF